MKLLYHSRRDPFYNIAQEEYLLKHSADEFAVLWWSDRAVVIGKHQNALAEVNYPYVYSRNIPVIRRLSGGGTVFHGPGNLNFTFIRNGVPGKLVDFKKHTAPIVDFLNDAGIPARFEGKNDIRVDGLKISGNAEHVYKQRILHHGTLLYNADLGLLNESIRIIPGRYKDKSVQSVRSRVANISGFLKNAPAFEAFAKMCKEYLRAYFDIDDIFLPGKNDEKAVEMLVREKYRQWSWNFGYSPDYQFNGNTHFNDSDISLSMFVKKGCIVSAAFSGIDLTPSWMALEKSLPGNRHEASVMLKLLKEHHIVQEQQQVLTAELFALFF